MANNDSEVWARLFIIMHYSNRHLFHDCILKIGFTFNLFININNTQFSLYL